MKTRTKEDKMKCQQDYMTIFREKNKKRINAQKNSRQGVVTDVFIMECF